MNWILISLFFLMGCTNTCYTYKELMAQRKQYCKAETAKAQIYKGQTVPEGCQ